MDSSRRSPMHSRTHSVIPSADKNQNGTDKDAVASTSAQVGNNRLGTYTALPPSRHVVALAPVEDINTTSPTSTPRSSMNTSNRTSVAKIPVFNKLGLLPSPSTFGSSPHTLPHGASLLSGQKQGSAPLRNDYSPTKPGSTRLLTTRRNEELPMVPASVPRGSNIDTWMNKPTSLRHPSAGNVPDQSSKWLTLLNVTNIATLATESRGPVPTLSSQFLTQPQPQASAPIPPLPSTSLDTPNESPTSANFSRGERRKKQREAVQARREVFEGALVSSQVAARVPVFASPPNENQAITRKVLRRLQNRASVQKCRARKRYRLEEIADERDILAIENAILMHCQMEIEDSGVMNLFPKRYQDAEQVQKSRESDPSKKKRIPGESSQIGDADKPFASRYLVQPGRPSLGVSTANPGSSFATHRHGHSSLAHAILSGVHNPSHSFNGASVGSVASTPLHPDNSHPLAAMTIRDLNSHRHPNHYIHAHQHPYAQPHAHEHVPVHIHTHPHAHGHLRPHLHLHPLNRSQAGVNVASYQGSHFNVPGQNQEQFMGPQGFGAHLHHRPSIAVLPSALPSASAALIWNNTVRGDMNYSVRSARGEFYGASQARKRLHMDDSEDDTHGTKRPNTSSM